MNRARLRASRRLLVSVACASLLVAACGSSDDDADTGDPGAPTDQTTATGGRAEADEPVSGGTLTYAAQGLGVTNFDPLAGPSASGNPNSAGAGNYLSPIFGFLVYEDWTTGEVVPQMAASLESTDPSHWTLTTPEGATFSNGEPFDAVAVKFSWEVLLNTDTAQAHGAITKWVQSLTVADPTTLEIVLATPNSAFGRTVAREFPFVVAPEAYQADPEGFAAAPVGAGPFVLEGVDTLGNASYSRNDTYWDAPRPYLDGLEILNQTVDTSQRYNAFASGQAQLTNRLDSATYPLAESAGYTVERANDGNVLAYYNLIFNYSQDPFDDPSIRRALQLAVDQERATQTISGPIGVVTYSIVDEDSDFFTEDGRFANYPEADPDEAQALFDAYAEAHGGPVTITYTIPAVPRFQAIADYLSAELASFDNVEFTVNAVAGSAYIETLLQGAFDITTVGMSGYDPVADFTAFFTPGGRFNFGGYDNPEVTALIDEANAATTAEARAEAVQDIQALLMGEDEYAIFSPTADVNTVVYDPEVVGAVPYATDGTYLWDQVWLR